MKELGLQNIPVAAISLGLRLRVVDEVHAQHLAENIQEISRLRSPIEVRKVKGRAKGDAYTIIAGGHRFRAVQLLGWTEVPAFVFEMTEQEARIWEIDENKHRKTAEELAALELSLGIGDVAAMQPDLPETLPPENRVVRATFGNLALKPEAEEDAFAAPRGQTINFDDYFARAAALLRPGQE